MASVSFRGVNKRFGTVAAVRDFSLEIADGEFVVLVGPSGCGKTTSLRILAGLEPPSGGHILLGGEDITGVPSMDRNIAMVFQNYALYPHMTVRENVSFALQLRKLPKAEIDAATARAAAMLGLEDLMERKPRQLSGGQRQRVAVCRAIVRDPEAFLFDEPLSNLDAKLRAAARTEIRSLQQELGVTTVYVTHDQVEAMTMADRIVVMHDGEIQQVGRPLDVYARPANLFVATFIGNPSMNLVAPTADLGNGNAGAASAGAQSAAMLGLRPESLALLGDTDAPDLTLSGTLRQVEALGAETVLHVDFCGQTILARLPGTVTPVVGRPVRLGCRYEDLHRFDDAGRRLDG